MFNRGLKSEFKSWPLIRVALLCTGQDALMSQCCYLLGRMNGYQHKMLKMLPGVTCNVLASLLAWGGGVTVVIETILIVVI